LKPMRPDQLRISAATQRVCRDTTETRFGVKKELGKRNRKKEAVVFVKAVLKPYR